MAGPLSLRARGGLVAALALVTLGLALAPGRLGAPVRRLANYRADTRDPIYNWPLDAAAVRRAGEIVPDARSATYYIYTRPEPQLGHDLIGAARLFFLPARATPEPRRADWILSYDAGRRLPRGVHALRTYELGDRIFLIRVRPS